MRFRLPRPPRPRPVLPLRWHLAALAVGVLAPLFAFAVGLFVLMTAHDRTATEQRLARTADGLAGHVDGELAAIVRTLKALAESERIDAGDLGGFRREADRARRSQTAWIRVILASPKGLPLVNTGVAWGEPLPAVTEARSLGIALNENRPVVGDLVQGGDGAWSFAVRVPVMRDGKLRAILTAVVGTEAVAEIAGREQRPREEWTRTVVDAQGTIVARTRDAGRSVGQPATASFLARVGAEPQGVYRDVSREGSDVFVAFSRSPLSGWTSAVVVPVDVLEGQSRRLLTAIALVGFTVVVLSGGGAFFLGRRLSRSIESATYAAAALARGETPRLVSSRVAEVNQLGAAFARSSELLRSRARERDEHLARAEAARAEAEAASRAKDEFLAMLGHELRNPLAPITTALHLLETRGGPLPREHGIVRRQVQQLVRLVDDLLDVSRITRGKIELRPERLELAPLVAQAVETVMPLLEQRRHRLALEVPPGLWVNGDPVRLAQVVSNLLTNAARYTPPGGSIAVSARASDERIALAVKDDGVGIPPDLLPRMFDLFVQGPRGADRREGGLGLGLTLVRSLVQMHGGSVSAESPGPGRGSTFTVALPRAAAPPVAAAGPEPRAGTPVERLRVLVVDDNRDAADLLGHALAEAGHDVRVAYDALAALELAAPFGPEVAVLDLGLPGMDGYALAAALRERLAGAAPALIAVSGYGQASDVARTRAAGFAAHHAKPTDVEALLVELSRVARERPRRSTTAA